MRSQTAAVVLAPCTELACLGSQPTELLDWRTESDRFDASKHRHNPVRVPQKKKNYLHTTSEMQNGAAFTAEVRATSVDFNMYVSSTSKSGCPSVNRGFSDAISLVFQVFCAEEQESFSAINFRLHR